MVKGRVTLFSAKVAVRESAPPSWPNDPTEPHPLHVVSLRHVNLAALLRIGRALAHGTGAPRECSRSPSRGVRASEPVPSGQGGGWPDQPAGPAADGLCDCAGAAAVASDQARIAPRRQSLHSLRRFGRWRACRLLVLDAREVAKEGAAADFRDCPPRKRFFASAFREASLRRSRRSVEARCTSSSRIWRRSQRGARIQWRRVLTRSFWCSRLSSRSSSPELRLCSLL